MNCAICNNDKFVGNLFDRPARVCSSCGAMERQRALWKILQLKDGDKILEIAPLSKYIFGGLIREKFPKTFYIGADRYKNGNPYDHRDVSFCNMYFDLVDMDDNIGANSLNVFIMQHVLEEIDDYYKCLQNIHMSLVTNGVAYLELPNQPIDKHIKHDVNKFGNVWRFSKNQLLLELNNLFEKVDFIPYDECNFKGNFFRCVK